MQFERLSYHSRTMRSISLLLLLIVNGACLDVASNHGEKGYSPIKKVVAMLTDMMAKGKKEKQDEQVQFAAFKQFCESTAGQKTNAIASGKETIEELEAAIAKAGADAEQMAQHVASLDQDMASWSADLAKNKAEREKDHAAFEEAHTEYVVSIGAVERALKVLAKGPGDKAIAQSFAQKDSGLLDLLQLDDNKMPQHLRKAITSFIQQFDPAKALLQEAEDEGIVAPAASAFEGSSTGIMDLIERLGEKFKDEKITLEKAEVNQQQAYEMMQADLTAQLAAATTARGSKVTKKAKRLEDQAEAKGGLADATSALAEDEKYLSDLEVECKQKSFDFQQRQVVRQGEIEAIGQAIDLMSSATGAGDSHLGLVQKPVHRHVSLAQLRSSDFNPSQDAVATFLEQQAGKLNSPVLALLASKAASDPFKKVRKMVQDMITKLMEEANAEAEHKGFCDREMGTNKQTRDKKTEQSDNLKADIEELTADVAKIATEISDIGAQMAELDTAVATATSARMAEKEKNQETLKDAKTAESAVAQAIALLKDFYAKAAVVPEMPSQEGPINWDDRAMQILKTKGAASFFQTGSKVKHAGAKAQGKVPGAPEMAAGGYTGMSNGGVIGLMEVCQSDFAKLIAETEATETEAERSYDKFKAESAQDKAVKSMDQKHKVALKSEKESNLSSAKKDLRITVEELEAAMKYYDKLKPDCEAKELSYAEKVAQRDAEIESLKEALGILQGSGI